MPKERQSELFAEPLLSELRRVGLPIDRIVYTQNRRVMVSVAEGGRTLRLHESFAAAPPATLSAVARLFASRSPQERSRARGLIRAHLQRSLTPSPGRSAPQRPPRPRASDRPHIARLASEFQRVNERYFDSSLPVIPIRLSGRMRRRNGHFTSQPLEIVISRLLCSNAVDGEAERTLRHEMIHLWQWKSGAKVGHGADFRRWAVELEIHPRATRNVKWVARC
jgi:hypothetical protein